MAFFFFLLLLFALGVFHAREHRQFVEEMRRMTLPAPDPRQIDAADWVYKGAAKHGFFIRRALNPKTQADILRYTVPVVAFAVMVIFLAAWKTAFLYAAIHVFRWSAVTVEVYNDGNEACYRLISYGRRLFTEHLK